MDARVRETLRMQRAKTEYIQDERREMMLIAAEHTEREARERAAAAAAAKADRVAREEAEKVAAEVAAKEQRKLHWEKTKKFSYSPARIPNFVRKVKQKAALKKAPETHRRGISEFDTSTTQERHLYGVLPAFADVPPPPPPPPVPVAPPSRYNQRQNHDQRIRHNKRASAHLISDSALERINRF